MGKKLDALLGRTFKVSKFKPLLNLAISRLAVLKNQRQVKCSLARSDVSQLLELGHHDRALLRVEQVIKEQNMFDVFVMTEGYCNLLIERVHLIEQERECPEELKEAISSLLFAASRIGEFPELQEIRAVLTSRYGKELAARSIELRNNCGVNPKMIQKLSTRQPDLENRMNVLREIAAEKNIVLKLEAVSTSTEETANISTRPGTSASSNDSKPRDELIRPEEMGNNYGLSDSMKTKKKYKDVADAAQAAFESAAHAAAAARAAVELSRSESHDPDDQDSSNSTYRKGSSDEFDPKRPESKSESKQEMKSSNQAERSSQKNDEAESKRFMSDTSTDSEDVIMEVGTMSFNEQDPVKLLEKETVLYDSDEERKASSSSTKTSILKDEKHLIGTNGEKMKLGQPVGNSAKEFMIQTANHLTDEKIPISVRTRQVRGY